MWNYQRQIIVRWLSFAISGTIILVIVSLLSQSNSNLLSQIGIKALLTQISVGMEFWPVYAWPFLFMIILCTFLAGMPSVIIFCILLPLTGFYKAFLVTFLCQVFTSCLAIIYSIRKNYRHPVEKRIKPSLKNKLGELRLYHSSFAFWSRVYFSYPLRSIDAITPVLTPDDQPIYTTIVPAASAIFLRMTLPCIWASSLMSLIKNISINPAGDAASFLFWSTALVAYTLMPRVPEFFICPEKIKECLVEIEQIKPVSAKGFDEEFELIPATTPAKKTNNKQTSGIAQKTQAQAEASV